MAEIAEDQDRKQKFRLAPPGWRWRPVHFLPFVFDLISSLTLVYLPVLVGRIIDLHLAGDTERAWQLMWWMVAIILYFAFNERAAWGITFRVVARLERDWKLYIGQLMRQSTQRDTGALIAILNKDIYTDADARSPKLFELDDDVAEHPGVWKVRQVLADSDDHHDWAITAEIDLAASDEEGAPVVRIVDVSAA